MSYARPSDSDVYVYATARDPDRVVFLCAGCTPPFEKRSEIIAHLREHKTLGDNVGQAIELLEAELADHGETEFRKRDG